MQKAFSFDKESLKKIGINALILGGATAGIYAIEAVNAIDFGQFEALVAMSAAFVIKVLQHYIQGVPQQ